MAEDGSKRSRWRDKLFSKETNEKQTVSDDVMDFLAPSIANARAAQAPPALPQMPKIDTSAAKRWPAASEIGRGSPVVSALGGMKKGRKAHLKVAFVTTMPDVIGEGGEEAELPVLAVGKIRERPRKHQGSRDDSAINPFRDPQGAHSDPVKRSITVSHRPSIPMQEEPEEFAPKPLGRTPTGWSDYSGEGPKRNLTGRRRYADDQDPLSAASSDPENPFGNGYPPADMTPTLPEIDLVAVESPVEWKKRSANVENWLAASPTDPNSFSAKLIHKMRAEEGRALHHAAQAPPDDDRPSFEGDALIEPTLPQPPPVPTHHVQTASASQRRPVPPPQPPEPPQQSQNLSTRGYQPPAHMSLTPGESPSSLHGQPSPSPYVQSQSNYFPNEQTGQREDPVSPIDSSPEQHVPLRSLKTRLNDNPAAVSANSPIQSAAGSLVSTFAGSPGSASNDAGDAALRDFSERVQHMSGIFRLTADVMQPAAKYSVYEWLRCCVWWFLRGRAGLESLIRSRQAPEERLSQPHVDLAKVVWILHEIFPSQPELARYAPRGLTAPVTIAAAREANDTVAVPLLEALEVLVDILKKVLASCSRNGAMPPHASLIQGQDQSIWVQYPDLPREVVQFVYADAFDRIFRFMPLADTPEDFAFGRMFVTVTVVAPVKRTDPVPCVLTIMRTRNTWTLKVAICSQDNAITLLIQDDHDRPKDSWGPSWRDVQWDTRSSRLIIDLLGAPVTPTSAMSPNTPVGRFSALVDFTETDFLQLSNTWGYTRSVSSAMLTARDERLVHEIVPLSFQYAEETNVGSAQHQRSNFPPERITRCRVRIFERFETVGQRKLHRGFRLLAVTSPKVKSLHAASMSVGNALPVVCEMISEDSNAALTLRNTSSISKSMMFMVFQGPQDRQALLNILTGVRQRQNEITNCLVRLTSLQIEEAAVGSAFVNSPKNPLNGTRWQDVMLIGEDETTPVTEELVSDNIRIVARGVGIGLTERLNLVPGELKLRLPPTGTSATPTASLSILRQPDPAPSTTIMSISSQPDPRVGDALAGLLATARSQATVQTYHFPGLNELHEFEAALTGHNVIFDGLAASFTVSHRIALVPIHKRHGAQDVRLQVLRQGVDSSVLILAFFEGFALTEAMCFKVLSMNVVEKESSKGVRLVDAKFNLPRLRREYEEEKGDGDGGWRHRHRRHKSKDPVPPPQDIEADSKANNKASEKFVSVDLLEYAGEHDDIVIEFEEEAGRDAFVASLPAQPTVSRGSTFKRKT